MSFWYIYMVLMVCTIFGNCENTPKKSCTKSGDAGCPPPLGKRESLPPAQPKYFQLDHLRTNLTEPFQGTMDINEDVESPCQETRALQDFLRRIMQRIRSKDISTHPKEAPKSVPSPGKRAGARGRYIYPLSKYLRLDEGRGIPFDDYFMKDLTNGQPPLDWELQYTQQYPFVQELDRASKPVTRSSVTGLILRALHDHLNQPTQLSAGGLIRDLLKERTMQRKYQEAQMECESMDGQSPSFLRNLCQLLGETI